MKVNKDQKINIQKSHIRIGLAVIAVLLVAAIAVFFVLPILSEGVVSVRVEAGKMECKTKIALLDSKGLPARGMVLASGSGALMAKSPYVDAELVEGPSGLRYTFLPSFEEIVRVDRATGKETVQAITGTYRYCFIAAASLAPGQYDIKAQVIFYNSNSEDASPISTIQIPYKLEVVPAGK